MSFEFTNENINYIEKLKKRYPKVESLVLPLLWIVQYQEGHISLDAIEEVAILTNKPPIEIYAVVTFYTMLNLEKEGKYHIEVCKTLSCMLCGKDDIIAHIEDKLDIKCGETTKDKLYTLKHVECLGSCGTAPMMQIGDTYYENLTTSKVDNILKGLK